VGAGWLVLAAATWFGMMLVLRHRPAATHAPQRALAKA